MRRLGSIGLHLLAYGVVFLFLFPYLFLVMSAFKSRLETFAYPPVWIFTPSLENFRVAIQQYRLLDLVRMSVVVATGATLLTFVLALPATLAVARFRFRFKEAAAYALLIMQMMPAIAVVFAFFFIFQRLRLVDTPWALILGYQLWNVPWAVWLIRGFIESIPVSLEESAMVDGCTRFQAYRRVTLPLAVPGLAAAAILIFLGSWNEFTLAFFLTSFEARTLPTAIAFFLTHSGIEWGPMFATATIGTVPVVVIALLVRRYFIRALTFGAVKE